MIVDLSFLNGKSVFLNFTNVGKESESATSNRTRREGDKTCLSTVQVWVEAIQVSVSGHLKIKQLWSDKPSTTVSSNNGRGPAWERSNDTLLAETLKNKHKSTTENITCKHHHTGDWEDPHIGVADVEKSCPLLVGADGSLPAAADRVLPPSVRALSTCRPRSRRWRVRVQLVNHRCSQLIFYFRV